MHSFLLYSYLAFGTFENKIYPKSAQAFDIFPLFIGSEGSLGVITEVTMKIQKYKPDKTAYASFLFHNFVYLIR